MAANKNETTRMVMILTPYVLLKASTQADEQAPPRRRFEEALVAVVDDERSRVIPVEQVVEPSIEEHPCGAEPELVTGAQVEHGIPRGGIAVHVVHVGLALRAHLGRHHHRVART